MTEDLIDNCGRGSGVGHGYGAGTADGCGYSIHDGDGSGSGDGMGGEDCYGGVQGRSYVGCGDSDGAGWGDLIEYGEVGKDASFIRISNHVG